VARSRSRRSRTRCLWCVPQKHSELVRDILTGTPTVRQIPSFYPLLDRVHAVLDPVNGLVGVADFYTSKDGGSARERVSPPSAMG